MKSAEKSTNFEGWHISKYVYEKRFRERFMQIEPVNMCNVAGEDSQELDVFILLVNHSQFFYLKKKFIFFGHTI